MRNSRITLAERERIARSHLEPEEELLWIGVPEPVRVGGRSLSAAYFAIPWIAFVWLWLVNPRGVLRPAAASSSPSRAIALLLAAMCIVAGVWMLIAPVLAARRRRSQVYALTDRRAVIIDSSAPAKVIAFDRAVISEILRTERSDRTGDLLFARESFKGMIAKPGPGVLNTGFFGIAEVRAIEKLMLNEYFKDVQNPTVVEGNADASPSGVGDAGSGFPLGSD